MTPPKERVLWSYRNDTGKVIANLRLQGSSDILVKQLLPGETLTLTEPTTKDPSEKIYNATWIEVPL